MQVQLLTVLLDVFFEGVVHDVELGQALEEQALHLDGLVLEEVHEGEERQVLVVAHDLQNDRHDKVHALAVADPREHVCDCTEHSLELILPLLGLDTSRSVSSRKVTLNLVNHSLVQVLRRLAILFVGRDLAVVAMVTDPVEDDILKVVVNEFGIVLAEFILIVNVELLLHKRDPLFVNLAFLHKHFAPPGVAGVVEGLSDVQDFIEPPVEEA